MVDRRDVAWTSRRPSGPRRHVKKARDVTHVSSAFGQTGVGLSRGRAEFTGLFDFCTERVQEATLVG